MGAPGSSLRRASVFVRQRSPCDLPVLAAGLLEEQRPHTDYPQTWPPPYPVERFIARPGELGAWVAELGGRVVGHVAVTRVEPDDEAVEVEVWTRHTARPVEELAAVSVLFVDHTRSGQGVGRSLLAKAVEFIREWGAVPVLDVVQGSVPAVQLYLRAGWQVVGEARRSWLPRDLLPALLMVLPEDGPD